MIKREILEKIIPWVGKDKILILKGSRQVGKTTLLKEIQEKLQEEENSRTVYLLADDIDNLPIFGSLATLETYLSQYYNLEKDFIYLIIDEFQVIPEAGRLLKNIYDKHRGRIQLIVSGSSSLEVNKNSEFLTGRAIHFDIERISFKEFFDYIQGTSTQSFSLADFRELADFYQAFKPKLEIHLGEYLKFGGYPEVITTKLAETKKTILKSIIKTYIEKDIINHLGVENITGFNNLLRVLSAQIGQMINMSEISNTAGLSINTLKKYVDILVGTYVFDLLTPYYKNMRSEISKMPKGYMLDPGIINYLSRNFNAEKRSGELIENFVYLDLKRRFEKEYLHYYRTISGAEIDFVIEKDNGEKMLAEVKYRNKAKITTAMKNFEKKYPKETGRKIVLTRDLINKEDNVYYIPVCLLPFVDINAG